jgi:hypothetical protein
MAIPVHVNVDGVWIAESGEYGIGNVVVLHNANVTNEQLTKLALIHESERFAYATAIMNGEDVKGWELLDARD